MDFKKIAKSIPETAKEKIKNAVCENANYMANFSKYKTESLLKLFSQWQILFPSHPQDVKCGSCRKAVVKFWDTICKEWDIAINNKSKKIKNAKKKSSPRKTK